jgi:hypothetical protein
LIGLWLGFWQNIFFGVQSVAMSDGKKKCMVCAKEVTILKGGICEPCQERIRREAMGQQAGVDERADKELRKHGVAPDKKQT